MTFKGRLMFLFLSKSTNQISIGHVRLVHLTVIAATTAAYEDSTFESQTHGVKKLF